MNLRRTLLAASFPLLIGASRSYADPTVAWSSITYCAGANPAPTNGQAPTIYTTAGTWYVGMTTGSVAGPGLMGQPHAHTAIAGTQALFLMNDAPVGGTLQDSSGSGDVLTMGAATQGSPGYDGLKYLIYAGGAPSSISGLNNSFNNSFTVEVWVNSPNGVLLQQGACGGGNTCLQLKATAGSVTMSFGTDSFAPGASLAGGWHFLAFTYDGAAKQGAIYVDGVQKAIKTDFSSNYTGSGTTYLGDIYTGGIDDIRFLNFAMGAGQIASDYTGQAYEDPAGDWKPYASGGNWYYGSPGAQFTVSVATGPGVANESVACRAEDASENVGVASLNISIDQQDLALPPQPSHTSVGYSSITWDWSSYLCNSADTTYSLSTNAGTPGAPGSTPNYSPTGLTPNTRYSLSLKATYRDAAGSGTQVGPSGASPTDSVWTLAQPPTIFPSTSSPTGTSVIVHLDNNAAAPPNPYGTPCEVWGQLSGGGSFIASPFQYVFSTTTLRSVTGLPKSSKMTFAVSCENHDGIQTVRGPATTLPFVTQPATPAGFSASSGNSPFDPGFCPKTGIKWSWGQVTRGSDSNPVSSYTVSQLNANGSISNPPGCTVADATGLTLSCIETGLPKGVAQTRVVQAEDTGSPAPFVLWSDTSAPVTAAPTADFTDAPVMSSATPVSTTGIEWDWSQPINLCASFSYNVWDAQTGAFLSVIGSSGAAVLGCGAGGLGCPPPTLRQNTLGVNTLHSVRVTALDNVTVSPSPLSASASAYTLADAPSQLVATQISTGSLFLQWNPGGNPPYTRYEVSMSKIDDFNNFVGFSTPTKISDNWTTASLAIGGLNPGSTYYFRVRAANGRATDGYGGLLTNFAVLGSTTPPLPPTLVGTSNSTGTVHWSWNYMAGATGYKLVNDAGTAVIFDNPNTAQTSFSSGPFLPNTLSGAKVAAYNSGSLLGPFSAPVYAFTLATTPVITPGLNGITGASSNTLSLSWDPNTNTSYTIYEVSLATDPAFAVIAATVDAQGVAAAVGGLFPGATYYARVRALNGGQQPTAFVPAGSACTSGDPWVSRSSAPASPYGAAPGLVGLWHFDESSGTAAGDASGWADIGALACLDTPANCSASNSTPTFTTNALAGLGRAVAFSGLRNSLLSIPDATQFDNFQGSVTVSAWVEPASWSQPDQAGLVAKGAAGQESFSLEVGFVGGSPRYRFRNGSGAVVTATSTIRPGQWDFVTGVYDAVSGSAGLYLNGLFASSATAVWPRVTNTGPLTIGNKDATGGGVYSLGFSGSIDDVRVLNGALTPAQVSALYQSYLPAQLTPPGPSSGVQLLLPPNAFASAASIYISDDPLNHPLRIAAGLLNEALTRQPTAQLLLPPSQGYPTLVEIVPTLDGVSYYNGPLGSTAVLSLPYRDLNRDGIIDGTQPPVPASGLQIFTLDPSVLTWTPLPTTVDTVAQRVSAQVPHFSVFALFGATSFGRAVSQVLIYPVPWKWNSPDRFGAAALTFTGLPAAGSIRILTLSGEKVIELPFSGTDAGKKLWDGRNSAGKPVASGVYFAQIKSAVDGSTEIKRFAIEK